MEASEWNVQLKMNYTTPEIVTFMQCQHNLARRKKTTIQQILPESKVKKSKRSTSREGE